jgi:glycosyltransferase involved in cell wall biosynthesis
MFFKTPTDTIGSGNEGFGQGRDGIIINNQSSVSDLKYIQLYKGANDAIILNNEPNGSIILKVNNGTSLISAFSKLDDRFQLKVIGTGPLKEDLEVTVKNLGVNNIEFHGYKNGDELNQLIKNSSFVIVPSEWYENNPLTIVEGYSMGKPVIGSNAGGIPELISDNNTGYLFEMSNLNSLIQKIVSAQSLNQLEYDNMSKKARQFADHHFSDEVHYKKLIDIYKEMLS